MSDDPTSPARVVIGIDTGGTFTDVTVLDTATGNIWTAKTPSTPADPSLGFATGLDEAQTVAKVGAGVVERVLHATTVATNLILEDKGPRTAMLVTDGFRFVVHIGRHDVPRKSSLFTWVKPPRPVPPRFIWEIPERIDADGAVIQALDEAAVRVAARAIADEGIGTVAIVFLHSYANADHERRAAEIVREEHPGALISISSDVLPVFREFERSMTTLLNVYVMPSVSSYVANLEDRIATRRIEAPLLLMKSNGGVTSARSVRRAPVETALSGPAAGVMGASFIGASSGFSDLITIDIGGTSADIGLIRNGQPDITTNGTIGDWRIGLPMVDVTTIGAGGGSIARVSDAGVLAVGPHSAGAAPGPVCYGKGGVEPTVTDAHLVLGHLPPRLLDGSFPLDREAAKKAIEEKVARPLGLTVEAAARGILSIADHAMVGAIRLVSVERGLDPRELVLVPFGGAGPLHGGFLARLIGAKTILVPPAPGVLSALGLLISNLRSEFSRTCLQRAGHHDVDQIASTFAALRQEAEAWLDQERVEDSARQIRLHASMRYEHQGFEITVPWPEAAVDAASVKGAVATFHALHERLYTFAQPDTPVEIVTLRVDAQGTFPPPRLPELPPAGSLNDAITGHLTIATESGPCDARVYDRRGLGAGAVILGPAVIAQFDATTYILPGQIAEVHPLGSLIVREQVSALPDAEC